MKLIRPVDARARDGVGGSVAAALFLLAAILGAAFLELPVRVRQPLTILPVAALSFGVLNLARMAIGLVFSLRRFERLAYLALFLSMMSVQLSGLFSG